MHAELAEREAALVAKLRRLPADKIAEVEDFVDFLHTRSADRALVAAAALATSPSLAGIWDNDEDAVYDGP